MRVLRGVLMLMWLLAALPAAAQETKPEDKKVEAKTVDPVVVTATTVATPATQLGVALSVVTEDDFRTYHYATVDEALRNLPGVEIRRSGSLGKISNISIRGANANQVQVLVDGVRVKSPTLGQVDLSDLSPDLIDRIEIIRGPQSTLYGADAIGGVVNIITKKGTGPFQASVQQEAGNYDTLQSRVQASGAWKIFNYAFSASHLESNGQFQNDGSNINALNGRFGVSLPFDSSLSFILRYNKSDTGVPVKGVFPGPQPIDPIINPNAKQQSETTIMLLEAKTRPVTWWESTARVSRYENNLGFQDPPDPGVDFDPNIRAQINVVRREVEWLNSIHVGPWSTSTVGIGYRHEEGDNKGVFHTARHVPSIFFEQQFRFFDRLFLTGGVRKEDDSVFGSATTEHGSLALAIKETGTRIRGGAGTGFRAPTFNDLFFPDFGNPTLQPERSMSWDAGVDQKFWQGRIRLGLTYFHNDFTNLITCCVAIPTAPFGGPVNVGAARSAGVEFTSEADILPNLVGSINYTYTETKNLQTRRWLPREPQHRWNIGLTWEPIRRLSLWTQVHVVTQQWETFGEVYNSGYTRVDLGGTYRVLEKYNWVQGLDLILRVQNLLNEGYAEVRGFPALGTNVLVGLRVGF